MSITLRNITAADVTERYLRWLNDPEVNRYLESRFTKQTMASLKEFVDAHAGNPKYAFFAICLKDTGEHIGNIKAGPIDPHHKSADVGLFIGEKASWGKGYATEAIAQITEHCFETLKLNKLTAGCYAANEGSARAFEKCGWTREGLRRGQVICDGQEQDVILLGIRAKDYKKRGASGASSI